MRKQKVERQLQLKVSWCDLRGWMPVTTEHSIGSGVQPPTAQRLHPKRYGMGSSRHAPTPSSNQLSVVL